MKWPEVSLLAICNPKQWPTISSRELTDSGYLVYGADGQIGFFTAYNHEHPTILITCHGATCGTLNICPPKTYVTGNAMALDEPRQDIVNFKFLYFALTARGLRDTITGAAQPQITRTNLEKVRVPLPALTEQRRIVELLEQADGLRRLRMGADTLADRILPALFQKMFGGPNRHYKPAPFSSLVREFRYGTSNRSEGQGKPALRIPNVVGEDLDVSDLKLVPVTDDEFLRLQLLACDMLFVRTNGNPDYVGRCAVFENVAVRESGFPANDFVFASYLIRARLKLTHANPHFIKQYLQSPAGKAALRERSRTSAGQFNINTEGLGSLPIPLPSLREQERFATFVLSMRTLRMQRQSAREEIDQIFTTMLHRAFTSELTAKWRETHLKELLAEMEHQARLLKSLLAE